MIQKNKPVPQVPLKQGKPTAGDSDLKQGVHDEDLAEQTEAELRAEEKRRAEAVKRNAAAIKQKEKTKQADDFCGCF